MRFVLIAFAIAIVANVLFSDPALATLVRCEQKISFAEKLCPNRALIAADKSIEDLYWQKTASLSERGWLDFLNEQREWLNFVNDLCGLSQDCIDAEKTKRKEFLEAGVVETRGGITFYKKMFYRIYPKDYFPHDRTGSVYTARVAYPYIDNPDADDQKAWNAYIKERLQKRSLITCEVNGGNFNSDYNLSYVTENFIGLNINYDTSCVRGNSGYSINRILDDQSDLFPRDVFNRTSNWKSALGQMAFEALGEKDHEKSVKEAASRSSSWVFLDDGLKINFGFLNGFAQPQQFVVISWEKLKPYLATNRPFLLPFERIENMKGHRP